VGFVMLIPVFIFVYGGSPKNHQDTAPYVRRIEGIGR